MPIFRLSDRVNFPPPHFAAHNGLLAIGGDLTETRLLLAYRMGIFPWFSPGDPILWWSPDPRLVMYPGEIVIPKRLQRTLNQHVFQVTSDTVFKRVIGECAQVRLENGEETWLIDDMIEAYTRLHELGYAHSIETWYNGELAGGLYGVSLGGAFFGESMFTRVSNASKVALTALCRYLDTSGFDLIDCQVATSHLKRLGAREIPRKSFLKQLETSMARPTSRGRWHIHLKTV